MWLPFRENSLHPFPTLREELAKLVRSTPMKARTVKWTRWHHSKLRHRRAIARNEPTPSAPRRLWTRWRSLPTWHLRLSSARLAMSTARKQLWRNSGRISTTRTCRKRSPSAIQCFSNPLIAKRRKRKNTKSSSHRPSCPRKSIEDLIQKNKRKRRKYVSRLMIKAEPGRFKWRKIGGAHKRKIQSVKRKWCIRRLEQPASPSCIISLKKSQKPQMESTTKHSACRPRCLRQSTKFAVSKPTSSPWCSMSQDKSSVIKRKRRGRQLLWKVMTPELLSHSLHLSSRLTKKARISSHR